LNDRDFNELLKRNRQASEKLSHYKEYKLHQRQEKMPALEDWDLSNQVDKFREEYVELRRAHDAVMNARQLTLKPDGTPIRALTQTAAHFMALEIADCANVLDALLWLLEDEGLLKHTVLEIAR